MRTIAITYFYRLFILCIIDVTKESTTAITYFFSHKDFYYQESITSLMLTTHICGDTLLHTEVVGIIYRTIGVGGLEATFNHTHLSL